MHFLFVEHISDLIKGQFIRGTKRVTENDFYLYQKSHTAPYFPPALIGETLGQLAAWNVMVTQDFKARPVAGIVAEASLKRPVCPGETLVLEAWLDHLDETVVSYHGTAKVLDEAVFSLEGALGPLLPMQDFIDEAVVREQFRQCMEASPHDKPPHDRKTHSLPWLYFDRILSATSHTLIAEKHILPDAPFFPDHFPKKPVLPLTVLLECITHLAQGQVNEAASSHPFFKVNPHPLTLRKIKMKGFVNPGDRIQTTLTLTSQTEQSTLLHSVTEVAGKRICTLELVYGKQP